MIPRFPIPVLVTLLCGACATSDQAPNSITGGFTEKKLAPDVVRVAFRGNTPSIQKERAQEMALMRAAELALQAGFPYFIVLAELNPEVQRGGSADQTIYKPKAEIVAQFRKEKPASGIVYDAEFQFRTLKEKYQVK